MNKLLFFLIALIYLCLLALSMYSPQQLLCFHEYALHAIAVVLIGSAGAFLILMFRKSL